MARPFETYVITKKCRYPERIAKLLDFLSTDEGKDLIGWGIEGVHYSRVNGKKVVTDEFIKGLYEKARSGIIKEFTGISDPYEEPTDPELYLECNTMDSMGMNLDKLVYMLTESGYLKNDIKR